MPRRGEAREAGSGQKSCLWTGARKRWAEDVSRENRAQDGAALHPTAPFPAPGSALPQLVSLLVSREP